MSIYEKWKRRLAELEDAIEELGVSMYEVETLQRMAENPGAYRDHVMIMTAQGQQYETHDNTSIHGLLEKGLIRRVDRQMEHSSTFDYFVITPEGTEYLKRMTDT